MSLRELGLKLAYETLQDDPVMDFYVPALQQAVRYDRIAGFFSSSSLAIAARGITGLITNQGKMRVIASPHLSPEDAKVLIECGSLPHHVHQEMINSLDSFASEAEKDHLAAFSWLLRNGYMEVRLAVVLPDEKHVDPSALFHQKVGIIEDENGDCVSFSGSINESASGWLTNSEEFKVFKSWQPGQDDFFAADEAKFSRLWEGSNPNIRVLPVPVAVREKLLKIGEGFQHEQFIARHYVKKQKEKTVAEKLSLFPYQKKAHDMWLEAGGKLLFEMATGTGKTRTAMACINTFLQKTKKSVVIISTPQSTLSMQWLHEIKGMGLPMGNCTIADGTHSDWRNRLSLTLKKLAAGMGSNVFVFTTHQTSCKEDFRQIILEHASRLTYCFVGDEAHGFGAPKLRYALQDAYQYRIGLSATPKRWGDAYGTALLEGYFGSQSFSFTIGDALSTINPITNKPFLVNYHYFPVFTHLDDNEFAEYLTLSKRIKRLSLYAKNSESYQSRLEQLLFDRARIVKRAAGKLTALSRIIDAMGHVHNTIIFAAEAQLDQVLELIASKGIIAHRFTQDTGTTPAATYGGMSERQYIIRKFREGTYQVLVAINCLNEGIDIPSADTAIIMASSSNPREYVQRIGRVIRQAPGKNRAYIYDFALEPMIDRISDPEVAQFERALFEKECTRILDMSEHSINSASVYLDVSRRLERARYGN